MEAAQPFVEYHPGSRQSNIILTAPHGGLLKPLDITDRPRSERGDAHTYEMVLSLAEQIRRLTNITPHVIVSHLHRTKMDANRPCRVGAVSPEAESAWQEYHAYVDTAKETILHHHTAGHLFDLHGHSHTAGLVELGYGVSGTQLVQSDAELDVDQSCIQEATIQHLIVNTGSSLSAILRGDNSLGTILSREGIPSVPSAAHPHPNGQPFFSGGYTVRRHGSSDGHGFPGGVVNATQMELPPALRVPTPKAQYSITVRSLAKSIVSFMQLWYPQPGGRRPKGAATTIVETGSNNTQHIRERTDQSPTGRRRCTDT